MSITNITKQVDDWYNTTIQNPMDLFFWNTVQGYLMQPECKVSFIVGTQTAVDECWDYAWIFRPMLLVGVSDILLATVFGGAVAFIVIKSTM